MSEPIKLPPDLLAGTLVREGVNKHRARDIEQWMNEKMALAVEHATGELRAEVERLRADAERYRWLRECARATSEHWGGRWSLVTEGPAPRNATPAGIDAAIDAARNALKEPE